MELLEKEGRRPRSSMEFQLNVLEKCSTDFEASPVSGHSPHQPDPSNLQQRLRALWRKIGTLTMPTSSQPVHHRKMQTVTTFRQITADGSVASLARFWVTSRMCLPAVLQFRQLQPSKRDRSTSIPFFLLLEALPSSDTHTENLATRRGGNSRHRTVQLCDKLWFCTGSLVQHNPMLVMGGRLPM